MNDARERWASAPRPSSRDSYVLTALSICTAPAIQMAYLKYIVVRREAAFIRPSGGLGTMEVLSLLRSDLFIGFFIMPLLMWLLLRTCPWRWMPWVMSCLSATVCLILSVELGSYYVSRKFVPLDLVVEVIRWGLWNPQPAISYLPSRWFAKLLVFFFAPFGMCWLAGKANRTRLSRTNRTVFWVYAPLGAATLTAWLPWIPQTIYHESTLASVALTLWGGTEAPRISLSDLVVQYRKVADAPEPLSAPAYWGIARGADVLWFVLETVPADALRLEGELERFPAIRRLRDRSWVGLKHFTTYPFTTRALYSLMTSQYAPERSGAIADDIPRYPGLVSALNAARYRTSAFGYGFPELSQAPSQIPYGQSCELSEVEATGTEGSAKWRTRQKRSDERCLAMLESELRNCIRHDQRYATIFAPQIGHGPWDELRASDGTSDLSMKVRDLIEVQDQWLARIIDLLESERRLEQTIILVTADHGVRMLKEDPRFRPGMIDETTFLVPMMLYAPMVLDRTKYLPWVTSHIDIAPSILDLLGIERDRKWEQGTHVWDERLFNRTTCFWATMLFGADGCVTEGRFFMWNRVHDRVYSGNRLKFGEDDFVPPGSPLHREFAQRIQAMDQIRKAWLWNVEERVGSYRE